MKATRNGLYRRSAGFAGGALLASVASRSVPRLEGRADGPKVLRGLASVYYVEGDESTEYWLWSDMVERIRPGAFDRAIAERHDARALFNHEPSELLGRVSAESLRLSTDNVGLRYEIDEDPADPDWQRVSRKVDRGDVTGSSFAFIPTKVIWEEIRLEGGSYLDVRNIHDVELYDVGPVTWPAYSGSTAGRSAGGTEAVGLPDYVRELRAERDRFFADRDAVAVRAAAVRAACA